MDVDVDVDDESAACTDDRRADARTDERQTDIEADSGLAHPHADALHVAHDAPLTARPFWLRLLHRTFSWLPRTLSWLPRLLYWLLLVTPLGCLIGLGSALFLYTLDWVTLRRYSSPWLLFLLPLAGLAQAALYAAWGAAPAVSGGVNAILEQIHIPNAEKDRATVPTRMGVLVWVSTLLTHLCGGSAGREGTALQVSASLANLYARLLRRISRDRLQLDRDTSRLVTLASLAAGFGSVFGTPFAGVVFALEVPTVAALATEAVVPAFIATLSASVVCEAVMAAIGMHHSQYPELPSVPELNVRTIAEVAVAAVAFGFAALLFSTSIEFIKSLYKRVLPPKYSRWTPFLAAFVGGAAIVAMVYIFQTRDYLGIGTVRPSDDTSTVIITTCFDAAGPCFGYSFISKLLFTVVTLASGYRGGEVTCLFFIGGSLGWAMAQLLRRSEDTAFFAACGFVSVFGGASNTPLASALMAVELFGGGTNALVYYALACYMAYAINGEAGGIYTAQRRHADKMARVRLHKREDTRTAQNADEDGLPLTAPTVTTASATDSEPQKRVPV